MYLHDRAILEDRDFVQALLDHADTSKNSVSGHYDGENLDPKETP